MSVTRRDFLKDAAFLSAALGGGLALNQHTEAEETKKASANDLLRVAVIGVGRDGKGQGSGHVRTWLGRKDCQVVAICDTDSANAAPLLTAVEKKYGKPCKFEQDIRKLLENKEIDAVSIATPNHWHALAAIWAMQAGKDVYVEKPVSHNVSEGRRIVEVARKENRICQTGTQIRSNPGIRQAIAFLQEGKLGKVKVARGLCYKSRGSIGKVKEAQTPPKTCDYDLWCGPAPNKPLMRQRLHYDWHWIWDYGNGDLGNQGIHQMDIARWGLGKDRLCQAAFSVGGRFGYIDDGETANTQICVFDYGDAELVFEVRGLKTGPWTGKGKPDRELDALRRANVGNVFHCENGYLVCSSYSTAAAFTLEGELIKKWGGGGDHFGNFVKAIRSRKKEDLTADILEGHISSALCHLGNISYQLGKGMPFAKAGGAFGDDKCGAETFESMQKHLKEAGVAVDKVECRVGRRLKVDPEKETFIGDEQANQMLTRQYRKGFEVPAKV